MSTPLAFSPELAQALAAIGAARLGARDSSEPPVTSPTDFVAWVEKEAPTLYLLGPADHLTVDLNDLTRLEKILKDPKMVQALSAVWARVLQKQRRPQPPKGQPQQPRIEFRGPADWIADWLPGLPDATGAVSVWETKAAAPDPSEWHWDWPLDVATVSDAGGEAIIRDLSPEIARSSWMPTLVKLAPVDNIGSADLLLLRGEPEAVATAVRRLRYPRGTPLVLIQSERPAQALEIRHALDELGEQFPHAGIGYAAVPSSSFGAWFKDLAQELTHNLPMDVALFRANREIHSSFTPVLRASPQLLQHATLGHVVTRLARRTRPLGQRTMTIAPMSSTAMVLGSGNVAFSAVAEGLSGVPRDEWYASEHGLASAVVEISAAAPPPPPAHRFLLTRLRVKRGDKAQKASTWLGGAVNLLSVQVAPKKRGWLVPEVAARFPVEEVVGDEESVEAEVTCDVKGVLRHPLRQSMTIRRVGESSVCEFPISVPRGRRVLTARVTVTHAGRIIQSGLFSGPVTTRRSAGAGKARPRWTLDAVIRSDLRGLARRRRFDAPLLLEAGSLRATNVSSGASFRSPKVVDKIMEYLDQTLSDFATNPDSYKGGLGNAKALDSLITLAALGSNLRAQLQEQQPRGPLVEGNRIQVVSVDPDARLPIELLYDGDAPVPKATLCKHAIESLKSQLARCRCGDVTSEDVVCPYRFWGLSRVIERHLEGCGKEEVGGDFAMRAEPTDPESKLELFRGSLVAGSERVTKHVRNGITSLQKQLAAVTSAGGSGVATTWDEWVEAVKARAPSLLLLLPHTEADPPLTILEIHGDRLRAVNLQQKHIGIAKNKPVVMLLGCETDRDPTQFLSIVGQCRRGKAALIVVFGATLAAQDAVPAASELITQLDRARNLPRPTLSEAMLSARQALVAKGWVPALGLVAYGDADWLLV